MTTPTLGYALEAIGTPPSSAYDTARRQVLNLKSAGLVSTTDAKHWNLTDEGRKQAVMLTLRV